MRALSAFQRLSSALGATSSSNFAAALAGTGACRLRLVSSTSALEQAKPQVAVADAFDQEFDRGDDEAMSAVRDKEIAEVFAAREAARAGLGGRAVDIDCEYDRDAPDCVDTKELYAERAAVYPPEVDLDTEFDRDDPLLADKRALFEPPPPPPEVDLDTEMDRDDPLLADKEHLWDCPDPPCPANIDNEMDLSEQAEEAQRVINEQEVPRSMQSPERGMRAETTPPAAGAPAPGADRSGPGSAAAAPTPDR